MTLCLPTYKDVEAAAHRIKPYVHKTPVLTSQTVNESFGGEVFFKAENLQRMGAFKFRGAMNSLLQFSEPQKAAGVIAFSSGNHAQAIALAAQILGIKATIIMPEDAPRAKVEATQGYGATVVSYDRYSEDREKIGRDLAEQYGYTLIPPYDHPHVLAGQGTAAKELFEEVSELDALFVCLGGGGLLSGCALAARHYSPACKIYGVEPEAGNDGQQSLRQGKIVRIETPKTIADGAQTQFLGQYTFPIIRDNVDDVLTVADNQLIDAMHFFAERMKTVVEPTGCLGFAAARQLIPELHGKRVGIIISGGNVDIQRYARLLLQINDQG
ncbi:threo-3-hydroxy-L-aspartate ammonia-lyase [Idiomarina seosinensis]|uniref:Serine dehydratase n=1 Tax=Idiomarina seosinensis TaxID=281739 RepID=A0A432ZJD1_9GAMM|nr:threo-3-hydroxy-L-aspartate ammonia-lyase [Idiomarina seosinensis]RUO77994.1 serine dehydratase [Idiomarina seosinensis]